MAEAFTFKIEGLKELQDQLERELPAVAKKIARSAVNAGGTMILNEARARVPQDTGFLKAHLAKEVTVIKDGIAAYVRVGALKADYPGGDKLGRTGYRLKFIKKSGRVELVGRIGASSVVWFLEFGTRAGLPGSHAQAPRPFLTNSLDSLKSRLVDLVSEKIREGLASIKRR